MSNNEAMAQQLYLIWKDISNSFPLKGLQDPEEEKLFPRGSLDELFGHDLIFVVVPVTFHQSEATLRAQSKLLQSSGFRDGQPLVLWLH